MQVKIVPESSVSFKQNSAGFSTLSPGMAESRPQGNYLASETFHTPSFGDEDFDINTLTLPPQVSDSISHSENLQSGFTSQAVLSHPPTGNMDLSEMSRNSMGDQIVPKFPPQNFDVPDISITNSLHPPAVTSMGTYSSVSLDTNLVTSEPLQTISHSDVQKHLGFHSVASGKGSPPAGSITSLSPNRESSSSDSDDSLPLAQLAVMKRQAAAAAAAAAAAGPATTTDDQPVAKKQKTPKKKKKKDPNEPQKPVSAYALFFRDTQAAIKGQNPNASFGEVSKIVASMWDGLDPEHKSNYKKKNENAKKEYLKQLATYRASLVCQAALDEGSKLSVKPITTRSGRQQLRSNIQSGPDEGTGLNVVPLPTRGTCSHLQHNQSVATSPQNSLSPPQDHMMGHMTTSPPYQAGYTSPPQYRNIPEIAPAPPSMEMMDGCNQAMPYNSKWCIRNGCTNTTLDNPGWDNEYCSNECVVSHCRDVFTAWAASRQGSNSFPVK